MSVDAVRFDVDGTLIDSVDAHAGAEVAGVPADRAVAVGDWPWDAIAAIGAGVRAIGARSGGSPDADLGDAGGLAIADDPAALLIDYERMPLAG